MRLRSVALSASRAVAKTIEDEGERADGGELSEGDGNKQATHKLANEAETQATIAANDDRSVGAHAWR